MIHNDTITVVVREEAIPTVADIEKLGRQRPAIFRSSMAEFFFCFSVMQSVLMAVSLLLLSLSKPSLPYLTTGTKQGLLPLRLQHRPSSPLPFPLHPPRDTHLALQRPLSRSRRPTPPHRPSGRHVRRLPRLQHRLHLVRPLGASRRLCLLRPDPHPLSRHARRGRGLYPPLRHLPHGRRVPARPEEELRLCDVRRSLSHWILPGSPFRRALGGDALVEVVLLVRSHKQRSGVYRILPEYSV